MTIPRTARALAAGLVAASVLVGCASAPRPAPVSPNATTPSPTVASSAPAASPTPTTMAPTRAVGLGDSIMAGTNCACDGPMAAWADAVERDRGVRPEARNLGVAGWTTADLTAFVTTDADARSALAEADTIVVIIGANDLFRGVEATALGERLDRTLAAVRDAHAGGGATFLVAGYWDILGGSVADRAAMAGINATIRAAARDAGMGFVDLAGAFAEAGGASGLISDDGLHPDAEGVRVFGEAIAAAAP